MELQAHFNNIHNVIINNIKAAKAEIIVAVAWFTDQDIFNVLCKKSGLGVKVSVALIADEINQRAGGINFNKLEALGGLVIFLPPSTDDKTIMHHKFCVIDGKTVITGSYNWSKKARKNDENITVITDNPAFSSKYISVFEKLVNKGSDDPQPSVDSSVVRRRLELIRNLILLSEHEDIDTHVHKLRSVADQLELTAIMNAIDKGEFRAGLELINAYIVKTTSLVKADFVEINDLRFRLEILELRLKSLSDEKADMERQLIVFNRVHDDSLGNIIQEILKAKAKLARLKVKLKETGEECAQAKVEADEADRAYERYSQQHEELQNEDAIPELNSKEEKDLKKIYRKACNLCHPDKVSEELKGKAHDAFVELQHAYKSNNLDRVTGIFEELLEKGELETRSSSLTEIESLEAAIAEMEYSICRIITELKTLTKSDQYSLLKAAGSSMSEWNKYFEIQRESLEAALCSIEQEIVNLISSDPPKDFM